jgi:hypothetical protein
VIDLAARGAAGGNLLVAGGRLLVATETELIAIGTAAGGQHAGRESTAAN